MRSLLERRFRRHSSRSLCTRGRSGTKFADVDLTEYVTQ
jgi:hypothetical protein